MFTVSYFSDGPGMMAQESHIFLKNADEQVRLVNFYAQCYPKLNALTRKLEPGIARENVPFTRHTLNSDSTVVIKYYQVIKWTSDMAPILKEMQEADFMAVFAEHTNRPSDVIVDSYHE